MPGNRGAGATPRARREVAHSAAGRTSVIERSTLRYERSNLSGAAWRTAVVCVAALAPHLTGLVVAIIVIRRVVYHIYLEI